MIHLFIAHLSETSPVHHHYQRIPQNYNEYVTCGYYCQMLVNSDEGQMWYLCQLGNGHCGSKRGCDLTGHLGGFSLVAAPSAHSWIFSRKMLLTVRELFVKREFRTELEIATQCKIRVVIVWFQLWLFIAVKHESDVFLWYSIDSVMSSRSDIGFVLAFYLCE